ncbi:MAG: OmpP1/FadL family transporter [Rhizobiaceae bacterium]
MINNTMKISALVLLATTAAANAGGYSRGSANLDPLFDGGTSLATSMTFVAPSRGLDAVNGVATGVRPTPLGGTANTGAAFSDSYAVFGATVALDVVSNTRCAATLAQPYGADANYGWAQILSGAGSTTSNSLSSLELGATCSYSLKVGPGNLYFLGGVFNESLEYNEARGFGFGSVLNGGDVSLKGNGYGYRIGAAYTIPEYAVKASLIYRSEVDHRLDGLTRNPAFGPLAAGVASFAEATTPQSVKLSLQTGVAPNWLVFGSVEWTDWSEIQQIQVFSEAGTLAPVSVPLAGLSIDAFFRDGLTVSGGVGHKFNEQLSGLVSLTWDRGVSKGRNVSAFSDTWTVAAGASYDFTEKVSLRGGLAYSRLEAINATGLDGVVETYGNDHAIAGGISLVGKF